ncbi:MAG: ribonuclease P protein component [Ignavibacteriales bacterium]|nr:ribonuclease P protein component [Ignavibacteriales bacterium]
MTSVRQERGATAGPPKSGRATLRETEILHGYRSFTSVISSGKTLVVRPVRLFYIVDRSSPPGMRVGFAVSRGIRGSVRRNRIKRLLRESFRLQKQPLLLAIQDQGNAVQGVLM